MYRVHSIRFDKKWNGTYAFGVRIGQSVSTRKKKKPECVNTEFEWDVKRGIEDSVRK